MRLNLITSLNMGYIIIPPDLMNDYVIYVLHYSNLMLYEGLCNLSTYLLLCIHESLWQYEYKYAKR